MAKRSAVSKLPQEVRRWLERSLEENGFGGYELLAELLHEKGYEISKSSLHRWGQDIERQRAAVRAETQAAIQLSEGTGDERDSRSEAVLALVQTGMIRGLRTIIDLQGQDKPEGEQLDPAELVDMLSKVGRNAATMTRASVILKKHQAAIEEAARKRAFEEAAQQAAETAKQQGLSKTGVDALRAAIMGKL